MPFTLAHPAAVLPFLRPPFVPAALVAGAVAPDVPYLLRSTGVPVGAQDWYEPFVNATTSHSPAGLVLVDLPVGLVLVAAWLVARRPLALLLPATAKTVRAGPVRPGPSHAGSVREGSGTSRRAGWAAAVVVSVVLGAATHLMWDGATELAVLDAAMVDTASPGGLTWGRALQHVSSVVGLLVLGLLAWRSRSRLVGPVGSPSRRRAVLALAVAGVSAVAGAGLLTWTSRASVRGLGTVDLVETVLSGAAKGALAATVGVAALAVAAWWVRHVLRARAGAVVGRRRGPPAEG